MDTALCNMSFKTLKIFTEQPWSISNTNEIFIPQIVMGRGTNILLYNKIVNYGNKNVSEE